MAEIIPAVGSRSQIWLANEATWGVVNPTPVWRGVRVIPGESLDVDLQTVVSREFRNDRTHNKTVRTNQSPGGSLPQELTPTGPVNTLLYHTLGGTPATSGTGPYTHVIKGASSLPVGFTLEKGFTDINEYFDFYGCRVSKATLTFGQGKIVECVFDILGQSCNPNALNGPGTGMSAADTSPNAIASHGTSTPVLYSGGATGYATEDPYASPTVVVYENTSSTVLGIATDMTLTIDNGLFAQAGYVLGSNLRQNLMPGTRHVTFGGKFIFKDAALYNKAILGTSTVVRIKASNAAGTMSHDFLLPVCQFLPSKAQPKIADDGPLFVDASGECLLDTTTTHTDIQLTVITSDAEFIA